MKAMDDKKLKEIEDRIKLVAPSPWRYCCQEIGSNYHEVFVASGNKLLFSRNTTESDFQELEYNSNFVVHARDDVPKLVNEVRQLQESVLDMQRKAIWLLENMPDASRSVQSILKSMIGDYNKEKPKSMDRFSRFMR